MSAHSARVPADILVAEDNALIGLDLEDNLRSLGVPSVRMARTVAEAFAAIDQKVPELSFLNVKLGPDTTFAIARWLQMLGSRFVFLTGYGEKDGFEGRLADVPKLGKPYTTSDLMKFVTQTPDS